MKVLIKKTKFSIVFATVVATLSPFTSYALMTPGDFKSFVGILLDLIGLLIPVLIGLSLVTFLWGVTKFIFSSGNEDSIKDGKQIMLWGIIALFVMLSVWGIVSFLSQSFGFTFGVPLLYESVP